MNNPNLHPVARENHMLGHGNIEKLLQEVENIE